MLESVLKKKDEKKRTCEMMNTVLRVNGEFSIVKNKKELFNERPKMEMAKPMTLNIFNNPKLQNNNIYKQVNIGSQRRSIRELSTNRKLDPDSAKPR